MAQLKVHLPCWRHTISSDPCEATSLPSDLVSKKCDSRTVNRAKTDGIWLVTSELGTSFCTQGKLLLTHLPLTRWGKQAMCSRQHSPAAKGLALGLQGQERPLDSLPGAPRIPGMCMDAYEVEMQPDSWAWTIHPRHSKVWLLFDISWLIITILYHWLSLLVDVAWYWSFLWLVVLYM